MSKKRRFYQLTYKHTNTPIFFEDMGNTLKISGILLEGMGSQILVIAPTGTVPPEHTVEFRGAKVLAGFQQLSVIKPTLEEWSELLRQTDDSVYFTENAETHIKSVHRKQRMAISGAIQQQIWARDDFTCVFCLRRMGDVPMTVDHFVPLELDGLNNQENYISCCRRCNKDKGNMPAHEYCEMVGVNYSDVFDYMRERKDNPNKNIVSNINRWHTDKSIRKKS